MQDKCSRRRLLQLSLSVAAIAPIPGLVRLSSAASLPPLDPADPTAKALGFVTNTTQVDAKASPTHKPDQRCGTCAQFQGKAGDASGGCNIFAGKSVPQNGWCRVWAAKSG